jgi:hypothetical protein
VRIDDTACIIVHSLLLCPGSNRAIQQYSNTALEQQLSRVAGPAMLCAPWGPVNNEHTACPTGPPHRSAGALALALASLYG